MKNHHIMRSSASLNEYFVFRPMPQTSINHQIRLSLISLTISFTPHTKIALCTKKWKMKFSPRYTFWNDYIYIIPYDLYILHILSDWMRSSFNYSVEATVDLFTFFSRFVLIEATDFGEEDQLIFSSGLALSIEQPKLPCITHDTLHTWSLNTMFVVWVKSFNSKDAAI